LPGLFLGRYLRIHRNHIDLEENLLPALPTSTACSYPTIKESWAALGWYLLCSIAVALVVLLPLGQVLHQKGPAKQLTTAIVGEGGLLLTIWWLYRNTGAARWPHLAWRSQRASWKQYAWLPVLVPAQLMARTPVALLSLPNWTGKILHDWSHYPVLAFGIGSIVGPVLEEYLFRGILLRGLLRNYRPWVAIGQSALLFGVFHMNPAQGLSALLFGLLLGWLYYRTQSLALCVSLHALNNALAFFMMRQAGTARDPEVAIHLGTANYWIVVGVATVALGGYLWWFQRYTATANSPADLV
jgi:membrane protease YdiL (CAAX protease family)